MEQGIGVGNLGTVYETSALDYRIEYIHIIHGIGIPDKDIPRIFERFYRVDERRSREIGGTGLEHDIIKHIIQVHNGKIWVTSSPGKGTAFSFVIPS